jgi:hypothetical protein
VEIVVRKMRHTPTLGCAGIIFSEAAEAYDHGYRIVFDSDDDRVLHSKKGCFDMPCFMSGGKLGWLQVAPIDDPCEQAAYMRMLRDSGGTSVMVVAALSVAAVDNQSEAASSTAVEGGVSSSLTMPPALPLSLLVAGEGMPADSTLADAWYDPANMRCADRLPGCTCSDVRSLCELASDDDSVADELDFFGSYDNLDLVSPQLLLVEQAAFGVINGSGQGELTWQGVAHAAFAPHDTLDAPWLSLVQHSGSSTTCVAQDQHARNDCTECDEHICTADARRLWGHKCVTACDCDISQLPSEQQLRITSRRMWRVRHPLVKCIKGWSSRAFANQRMRGARFRAVCLLQATVRGMIVRRQRRVPVIVNWLDLPNDLMTMVVQCIDHPLDFLALSASSFQMLALADRNVLRRARDTADWAEHMMSSRVYYCAATDSLRLVNSVVSLRQAVLFSPVKNDRGIRRALARDHCHNWLVAPHSMPAHMALRTGRLFRLRHRPPPRHTGYYYG